MKARVRREKGGGAEGWILEWIWGENIDSGGFFFSSFFSLLRMGMLLTLLLMRADGEGNPGAAHPPPGAGEGQRIVQGLLQPLHHLPQNQDAQ